MAAQGVGVSDSTEPAKVRRSINVSGPTAPAAPGGKVTQARSGPLIGIRVLEFAGIGPAPFCGMVLADLGAEVIRLDRPGDGPGQPGSDAAAVAGRFDVLGRGKQSVAIDLKSPAGVAAVHRMAAGMDALIEGYRPGVMERLGLGPDVLLQANPRLVYGRMTGWGQDGPLARTAGHDINYLGLTGMLSMIGRAGQPPVAPPALLGDFGGGGLLLALGVACALLEAARSGRGQIVDAAIVDGVGLLAAAFQGLRQAGVWRDATGENFIDSGSHFYDVYECADRQHVAVGAIEPRFFQILAERAGLQGEWMQGHFERAAWAQRKQALAKVFRSRTREEWVETFAGSDACVTPVLNMLEATRHPHAVARQAFAEVAGVVQPAAAPRFSLTPAGPLRPPPEHGADTETVLTACGFSDEEIRALRGQQAIE